MENALSTLPAQGQPVHRRRRIGARAGLVFAALLLHAALLDGVQGLIARRTAPAPPGVVAVSVRSVSDVTPASLEASSRAEDPPSAPAETDDRRTDPVGSGSAATDRYSPDIESPLGLEARVPLRGRLAAAVTPEAPRRPPRRPAAQRASVARADEAAAPQAPEAAGTVAPDTPVTLQVATSADRIEGSAAVDRTGVAPPVVIPLYRTLMPPPVTLRYRLQRGLAQGDGELRWQPAEAHYALNLVGRLAASTWLEQSSQGSFDTAGVAPLRFTDRRQRRQTLAVNFQRDAGTITFSGPSTALALQTGTQDRLSWMIQLAAVLAAQPELLEPGRSVVLPVVGTRADAAVWTFRSLGAERMETAAGSVQASRLVRTGEGPYDPTIEVWVDPARHCLPVRTLQRSGTDELEWLLESMAAE